MSLNASLISPVPVCLYRVSKAAQPGSFSALIHRRAQPASFLPSQRRRRYCKQPCSSRRFKLHCDAQLPRIANSPCSSSVLQHRALRPAMATDICSNR
ncbi:hypothetical protein M0R45_002250 [Rubus argutus]|uniref:Uncharacterized protein n=1 Tax=Rubus argutus TaxID=59490 RepID=A0AAW1VDM3_RUBAR